MVTQKGSSDDQTNWKSPQNSKELENEFEEAALFPVVGIGASAGGLGAVKKLLEHLPSDTGLAFLFVQHLDPQQPSYLASILAKVTPMPVIEASTGLAVRPNHLYVIPPGSNLTLAQGILYVTPRGVGPGPYYTIDHLFQTLAIDQSALAIGVVLSGGGFDGTVGLRAIKEAGGITFAQDEMSAEHPDMPRNAIDNGYVDYVLAPEAIAQRLAEIRTHLHLMSESRVEVSEADDQVFRAILRMVRSFAGVDFSLYRDTTIRRRIMRRMAIRSRRSLSDYYQLLKAERTEVEALYHDSLINVTSFFREPDMGDALKTIVFPRLVEGKSSSMPLRIWVPGCSTGQEPYSLAIALLEFYDDRHGRPPVLIFATDVNESVLQKARAGVYPESIEAEVSPGRLRRFFHKEDHLYRIDQSVRDLCIFGRQNITADPPFSHLDLISCRNLFIYLATPVQKRVVPLFHYALNVPGFLVLGSAESVGEHTDLFEVIDRKYKIYAKKTTGASRILDLAVGDKQSGLAIATRWPDSTGSSPPGFQREADRILLRRFTPPGVLVNENLDIVRFHGQTSPYLGPPPGEPTMNLLKMVRTDLFTALRRALAESKEHKRPARHDGIRLRANGGKRVISVETIPITSAGAEVADRCFLVLFHEVESSHPGSLPPDQDARAQAAAAVEESVKKEGEHPAFEEGSEVAVLRQELATAKEYLQAMMEQQDAVNEELRSANEEILSSNEELQSTNEELETSKEELQSTNEELITVNERLQYINGELDKTNNDLINLLASTQIPVIMIGRDLRIRRFTESAKETFNLVSKDVGRSIRYLNEAVPMTDFEELVSKVVAEVQPLEQEVRARNDHWYVLRIYPYLTTDHKIDGAVVVLLDIDALKRTENELRAAEERLRSVMDKVVNGIITTDKGGHIQSFNPAAERLFGYSRSEAIGQNAKVLLYEFDQSEDEGVRSNNGENWQTTILGGWHEVTGKRKDGSTFPMELAVSEFHVGSQLFTWIVRDITERKRAAQEGRRHLDELAEADSRKDDFLATLAHELRNPLTSIYTSVQLLRRLKAPEPKSEQVYEVLQRQVAHLARLVEDLLDVSRITRGTIELRKERVLLGNVIESAIELSKSPIESSGHQLSVSLPPQPIILEADPVRLAQVFANLLNNASKFTDEGGQISLTARQETESVVVSVCDTGVGIPEDLLPEIFGMFKQGESPVARTQSGLGIGLTLVRSLVELHGGHVEAHSEGPGKGSEFVVRLPLVEGRARQKASSKNRRITVASRHCVLLIDDNRDLANTFGMLLKETGIEVRVVYDGPTALEMLETFKPSVVLLDIGMSGMDGYEVARRIRKRPGFQNVPLIALTGWGTEEDVRRSQAAGFNHHLIKPVLIENLLALLDSLSKN
ncbi:MAG: PAS domain S-box protein [Firmicutes bacterium]|nr:PAS domain S-box protein [Bacillota bacterium]